MKNKEKRTPTKRENMISSIKELRKKLVKAIRKGMSFNEVALFMSILFGVKAEKTDVTSFFDAIEMLDSFDSEEQKDRKIKSAYSSMLNFINGVIESLEEDEVSDEKH